MLIVLAACAAPEVSVEPEVEEEPKVPEKIIEERVVVQCWDDSTAESLEDCPPKPEETPKQEESIPPAKKLLAEARTLFESHAYLTDDKIVIIHDGKVRHYFLKMWQLGNRTPITDVYVDLDKNEAYAYCNIEREADLMDNAFDYERSRCKGYINSAFEVNAEEWRPNGPIQYLERFANNEPILVEDNVQTINIGGNSKTIQPSLHYMEDGKRVILRIDKRYKVPLKVEREGEKSIDFRDAFFDKLVINGKQFTIDESWVTYEPVSEYWLKG